MFEFCFFSLVLLTKRIKGLGLKSWVSRTTGVVWWLHPNKEPKGTSVGEIFDLMCFPQEENPMQNLWLLKKPPARSFVLVAGMALWIYVHKRGFGLFKHSSFVFRVIY